MILYFRKQDVVLRPESRRLADLRSQTRNQCLWRSHYLFIFLHDLSWTNRLQFCFRGRTHPMFVHYSSELRQICLQTWFHRTCFRRLIRMFGRFGKLAQICIPVEWSSLGLIVSLSEKLCGQRPWLVHMTLKYFLMRLVGSFAHPLQILLTLHYRRLLFCEVNQSLSLRYWNHLDFLGLLQQQILIQFERLDLLHLSGDLLLICL